MSKVTRIAYSDHLTQRKYRRCEEIAFRLGRLRAELWQRYGSVQGVNKAHREIRDQWLQEGRRFDVPARLWKETLRDIFGAITAYRESAKDKVRSRIHHSNKTDEEKKRLYRLLSLDDWLSDMYLRKLMRKYYKHGHTHVCNQIILDTGCYSTFLHGGRAWLEVMSLEKGCRIAIPLNTDRAPSGTLRLILRQGRIEVHYAVEEAEHCSTRRCGTGNKGIDKGYSEAYTDSDGQRHGQELGALLSQESDKLKIRYQGRNKLKAIAEAKLRKRANIERCNLGTKKRDAQKARHTQRVRDVVYRATHSVVNQTGTIVCEDLTATIKGSQRQKDTKRRLSGWVKGWMAEAISAVSHRRGASVALVNCAYTSQMDSRFGVLLGQRSGDSFYCYDGEVLDADTNAARNILARLDDHEITLFMPHRMVKAILRKRTEAFLQRLRLSNQDSSCISHALGHGGINGERITFDQQ